MCLPPFPFFVVAVGDLTPVPQAILNFIVYGTTGALELWAPQYFYRIGALIGYILTVIFWLTAWAWSASDASAWISLLGYRALGGALGGCAGLGAIAW